MFKEYFKSFISYLFGFGFLFFFIFLFFINYNPSTIKIAIILSIFLFLVSYSSHNEIIKKINQNYEEKLKIQQNKEKILKESLKERASGFPTLFKYIQELDEKLDNQLTNQLLYKKTSGN